jgi:hypothetical protein
MLSHNVGGYKNIMKAAEVQDFSLREYTIQDLKYA